MGAFYGQAGGLNEPNTTLGQWVHYARVREGTALRMYRGGQLVGSTTIGATPVLGKNSGLLLGRVADNTSFPGFYGYMDEIRVTKGVARYSANCTRRKHSSPTSKQQAPVPSGALQLGYTKCDYFAGGHMTWKNPTPYRLIPTEDSESFKTMPAMATGLPLPPHPGAFGVRRKMHFHEGVDLYLPTSTPITAVEEGEVIEVRQFTGPELGQPWWHQTWAVWVQGPSGVVVYGEIAAHIKVGAAVHAGTLLGVVIPVLTKNKGRPMTMLHIELHSDGSKEAPEWLLDVPRPAVLRDPTPFLLECA